MPSESDSQTKFKWREVARSEIPTRSATERVADFLEVYSFLDEETAREQAARCIQCPEPSCVTGCPMASRIPEWLALTAEGHFLEAADLMMSTGSMPEVFSRICAQDGQCEAQCLLGGPSDAVSIGAIERFLQEYAWRQGTLDSSPVMPNGYRVTVVGSGPGGLVCANDLSRLGYAVTVFESHSVPGGLLVNGLPAFKLERSILERRIEWLKGRGVEFRCGVRLGEEVHLHELRRDFDAVFLAVGARQGRPVKIPGADLGGVWQAVPFLFAQSQDARFDLPPLEIAGRRVVVLGAGDTAMDCLRTAIRCGAAEAICLYRRDEASVPAMRHHYSEACEEGARFRFQVLPVALEGNVRRQVTAVRCVETRLVPDPAGGCPAVEPVDVAPFEVPAELVVVAYGFERGPCPPGCGFEEMAVTSSGLLRVDDNEMTSLPGVFAGGDLVHGPGELMQSVREARKAARGIHAWLAGKSK